MLLAADALIISSDVPMRLTWVASVSLGIVGLIAATTALVSTNTATPTEASAGVSLAALVAVVGFLGAIQTAAVAIVGEYVVRTYREAQSRPTWVVRRTINVRQSPLQASDSRAA